MDNLIELCTTLAYILLVIAWWKIFAKAGLDGWKSLIPFYNLYLLFKITWGNGWYALLLLIPVVNIVVDIITAVKMARVFGKGNMFTLGLVFLPNVFELILGFGDDKYLGLQEG